MLKQSSALWPFPGELSPLIAIARWASKHDITDIVGWNVGANHTAQWIRMLNLIDISAILLLEFCMAAGSIVTTVFLALQKVGNLCGGVRPFHGSLTRSAILAMNSYYFRMHFVVLAGICSAFFYMELIIYATISQYQVFISGGICLCALLLCFGIFDVPVMPVCGVLFEVGFIVCILTCLAFGVQLVAPLFSKVEVIRSRGIQIPARRTALVSIRRCIFSLFEITPLLALGRLTQFAQRTPPIAFALVFKEELFGGIFVLAASMAEFLSRGLFRCNILGYSIHAVRPQFLSSRPGSVDALAGANIITPALYHTSAFKAIKGGFHVC